MGEMLGM